MGGLIFCVIQERMIICGGTKGTISSNRSYFIDREGSFRAAGRVVLPRHL